MATLKTTLKVIGYVCLVIFSIYAGFISANKNLALLPIFAWA